jgi:hypothetical protein
MLIEELFAKGVMTMGASRVDPQRQVAVFSPATLAQLAAARAAELEKLHWLAGEWNYENRVPATRLSPAYTDIGSSRFTIGDKGAWICLVEPDGKEIRHITYDAFGCQWIYVLARGSYGILRSREGWMDGRIVFAGRMIMLGVDCEWRITWTHKAKDAFGFTNEERLADGTWAYIDEWHFTRR